MEKFVVGLRGGIGTGKSSVSNIFESLGIDIADADISSRNVMKPGERSSQTWSIILERTSSILQAQSTGLYYGK